MMRWTTVQLGEPTREWLTVAQKQIDIQEKMQHKYDTPRVYKIYTGTLAKVKNEHHLYFDLSKNRYIVPHIYIYSIFPLRPRAKL